MPQIADHTILITGGAGFVGSYLVEELLPHNPREIILVDNMLRGSRANMAGFLHDPRVTFLEADIRNTALMEDLMVRSHYLYHLAALRITRCAEDHELAFEVMVRATFDLLQLAVRQGIQKVIYSSSASVYGLAQHFPTPESDNPYDNRTFYGAAKLWGESLLRNYADFHGLDYVALRYFNIYGARMDTEGKYTEVMIKWLDRIQQGLPPLIFGDGSTSMDFVYVSDVARANVLALQHQAADQVYNIGYGRETSLLELAQLLLKAAGRPDLQPEFREERQVNPVPRRLADTAAAERELGFRAEIPLEQGLDKLLSWYNAQKAAKPSPDQR